MPLEYGTVEYSSGYIDAVGLLSNEIHAIPYLAWGPSAQYDGPLDDMKNASWCSIPHAVRDIPRFVRYNLKFRIIHRGNATIYLLPFLSALPYSDWKCAGRRTRTRWWWYIQNQSRIHTMWHWQLSSTKDLCHDLSVCSASERTLTVF